jgi:predicted deacetylase
VVAAERQHANPRDHLLRAGPTAGEAQYLLRLDDLCPTMNRERWQHFARLLREFAIHPILAVIPDNHDLEFAVNNPDSQFWEEMRSFELAGAAIGLHGYQHVCQSHGRSLIPLHRRSEFAGATEAIQRDWISRGADILRAQGLDPKVWVAPRHGLDRATMKALGAAGIRILSDGFAERPFGWLGATWIPQQLWAPVERDSGLWTICMHPAAASDAAIAELERFLATHSARFTSVDRVLKDWPIRSRSIADRLFHSGVVARSGAKALLTGKRRD